MVFKCRDTKIKISWYCLRIHASLCTKWLSGAWAAGASMLGCFIIHSGWYDSDFQIWWYFNTIKEGGYFVGCVSQLLTCKLPNYSMLKIDEIVVNLSSFVFYF